MFYDRLATWAAAPEMRLAAASIDPVWLPSLVAELSRIGFDPVVERTRSDVLRFAEFRHEMLREFAAVAAIPSGPSVPSSASSSPGDPA